MKTPHAIIHPNDQVKPYLDVRIIRCFPVRHNSTAILLQLLTTCAQSAVRLFFIGSLLSSFCSATFAQNLERISKREVEQRQAALPRGVETLERAQAAMQARNYV